MWSAGVVVRDVLAQYRLYESFGVAVRSGRAGRDLHDADVGVGVGQNSIECGGGLPGTVADEESGLCGLISEFA
jgi:hypothetical protein